MGEPNQMLIENLQNFEQVRIRDIHDIRSVDTDIFFIMKSGQRILWHQGSLTALKSPELILNFKDGTLRVEQIFQQIESFKINKVKDGECLQPPYFHCIHGMDSVVLQQALHNELKWILI